MLILICKHERKGINYGQSLCLNMSSEHTLMVNCQCSLQREGLVEGNYLMNGITDLIEEGKGTGYPFNLSCLPLCKNTCSLEKAQQ